MNCPACSNPLSQVLVGDLELDICKGSCGGIWFDNLEIKKLDEPHEHVGEGLLNIEYDPKVKVDHQVERNCPSCDEIVMRRHFFSAKRNVEVDACGSCGGFWLDLGELQLIRSEFKTEEERKQHAMEHFKTLFEDDLEEIREESEKKLESARKVARIFRFICPSNYIPGKQKWGAW